MFGSHRNHEGPLPYVKHRPTTNPILPVADMAAAIEFYRSLGFEVVAYDDGYAWVKHCGWEWFHLRRVDSVDGNESSAYLHVENADAWHAGLAKSSGGAVELSAVEEMPWGKREFSFTDPAGNLLRLGANA